jgi:WD40 repeat protein
MIASGGWDKTIQFWDIRKKGPIASIYGPKICGDAIDFKEDGNTILTGSYRDENCLELFDIRTFKKIRGINWNGENDEIDMDAFNQDSHSLEKEYALGLHEPEKKEEEEQEKPADEELKQEEMESKPEMPKKRVMPFVYSALFNNEHNKIFAGGAGDNDVRVFDATTYELLTAYCDLPKAVSCIGKACNTADFAFGSIDSKIRCMASRNNL